MNEKSNSSKKGTFNRSNPLLERKNVPFEFVSFCAKKNGSNIGTKDFLSRRKESFTLRVLEGHRTNNNNTGGVERAIRLEISDEYRRSCLDKATRCNGDENLLSPYRSARKNNDSALPMFRTISSPPSQLQSYGDHNFQEMAKTTDSQKPVQLYELEVGESDFAALQQDQALLVDFTNFSKSFINLLKLCDLGSDFVSMEEANDDHKLEENKEYLLEQNYYANPLLGCQITATGGIIGQSDTLKYSGKVNAMKVESNCEEVIGSMYTCRIEEVSNTGQMSMNSWNNKNGMNMEKIVRFSIVESNQFRELTHLSLNLQSGDDASVKLYLSMRLSETLGSIAMLKYQLQKQINRALSAEKSCNDVSKSLNELVAATEKEKSALFHDADQTIQKQNARKDEELQALKERSNYELHELKMATAKVNESLTSEINRLGCINEQLEEEKSKIYDEKNRLISRLAENENKVKLQSVEMKHLHDLLDEERSGRKKQECQLQETKEELLSLQKMNEDKGSLIKQMEDKITLTSLKSQEAHENSESCAVRLHATEQELKSIQEEYRKAKELLTSYQSDRQEMKRRMKSKVELIQKQEEILASKEYNSTETQQLLEKTQNELMRMKNELAQAKKDLHDANHIIEENKKKMESDQKVISWLNKEANERKGKLSSNISSSGNVFGKVQPTRTSFTMSSAANIVDQPKLYFTNSTYATPTLFPNRNNNNTTSTCRSNLKQVDNAIPVHQVTPHPIVPMSPNNIPISRCHIPARHNQDIGRHFVPTAIDKK